ncbi:MAG: hypothetical protein M5T61_02780 [Acidimicrobiia bacterium]|nr:hypothetical protein [Acidimicrobiia bacterium]
MDDNGGYVIAGFALTGGVLAAYVAWLGVRLRRARRSGAGTEQPRG